MIAAPRQIMDVWAIRLEPVRVSLAQLALLQRAALGVGAAMDSGPEMFDLRPSA